MLGLGLDFSSRAVLGGRGGTPLILSDDFSRYANATVMNGQVPLIGNAWTTTGSALPTIGGGLLKAPGTGYLYTQLKSPAKMIGARLGFTGGTAIDQETMALVFSPDYPLVIQNLLHLTFGPTSFVLGVFQSGVFTGLYGADWTTPMSNDGVLKDVQFSLNGTVASIVGPGGEIFRMNDPRFPALWGTTAFWEPNLAGDGLQTGVALAYASNVVPPLITDTLNPNQKTATVTLSGGNLTVTSNSATGEPQVLGIAPRSAGKVHVEFTINHCGSPTIAALGVGFASISEHVLTNFVGGDFRSWGFWGSTNGSIYTGAVAHNQGTGMRMDNGDLIAMEIDFDNNLASWMNVTKASGWNLGNGPFSFSGAGAPFAIAVNTETSGDSVTVNTGGSPFGGPVTSGFGNWL